MEGNGKTPTSGHLNFRIPKKKPNSKSEDVHLQSPLSRLTDSHQWDCPLQEWKLRTRNQESSLKWKRQRDFDRPRFIGEGSTIGQPKVMLTNILRTEIGRKYTQSLLKTDANLSAVDKLQTDRPTSSSVASLEILQILSPPLQSLFISKRQPKVILKNVLRTKIGRKYIKKQLITDANLSDADKLLSGQPTSSIANLQTCHILSPPHQSPFISKRYEWHRKKTDDSLMKLAEPSKEAESNNALFTVRRYNQQKKENKESDPQDKETKISNYTSLGLREPSCLNSEKRKRRLSGYFSDESNACSPGKLPSSYKEERIVSTQVCRSNLIQKNISLVVEAECKESSIHDQLEPALSCAKEHCLEAAPRSLLQKQYSATSEDVRISPLVGTSGKKKMDMSEYLSKLRSRVRDDSQSFVSAEPIVLSSDDEGSSEPKHPEELDLQHVHDGTSDNKKIEQEPKLPLAEELLQDEIEDEEQPCVPAVPLEDDSCTDLPSCDACSKQIGPALDIKLATLYIGNIKGTSTGYVTFTTRYINIPFEVALNKNIELSVDTVHLRKFGLWRSNEDCHSSRSNTFIFLWLSADYVKKIEAQLEKSVLSKPSKSNEFIFLELFQPLTEREQIKLNEVIAEVSRKNRSPDLSDFLSWKHALPLFKDLSPEESSFMNCCQASFQQQLQKDSIPVLMDPLPQEPKVNVTRPSYALLQKQNRGSYSISLSSKSDDEWKEIKETGPVQNLIVYPPPPTKGGLGVTREDLECLEYGEFLNDVIIDFYLKYLLLEKAPKQLAERSHVFSSFFYKCLTRTEKNSEEDPKLSVAQRRHKRVRTWTRHINIFNKDYIFVPVNEESHWYIAVICFPWLEEAVYEDFPDQGSLKSQTQQSFLHSEKKRETVRTNTVLVFNDNWKDEEELDVKSSCHSEGKDCHTSSPNLESEDFASTLNNSILKKVCRRPCILILDSLKASSVQNTVQILREYLEIEWEAKRKTHREFSKSTMLDFCPRVPKQDNSSDCGVYLLQYVETFFQDPVVNFELPMHLERWFPRRVVRSKREEIRDLILQLHLQQQSGSSS
ncbi:sentrin-specific protease 7 isoform X1 [Pelodiscus sinensis]|uniref:sentrin-specific protease 7 isoform X1 n=1 Tax=Pelodiscus sinensis TaxID=13735 RepID=UPI003F6B0904